MSLLDPDKLTLKDDTHARCSACIYFAQRKTQRPVFAGAPGSGSHSVTIDVCVRFPQEIQKAADDYCGEWRDARGGTT